MTLLLGDCLEQMKTLADNSVDAVVTDPPYGLAFMNKKWDYDVPSVEVWKEVYRVLKPGGHVLSFGGTRTYHRMVVNIEDAGFEIRDSVYWHYGQGFPKSHNVYKSAVKDEICCVCDLKSKNEKKSRFERQNLHNLRESVDGKESLSGEKKQNVLSGVPETFSIKSHVGQIQNAAISMSGLQKRISSEVEKSESDLLLQVSGQAEVLSARNDCAHEANCEQRPWQKMPSEGHEARKKPSLEGRDYLQTEQGKLHRSEVCEMSEGIFGDVSERRLRNGTSLSDSETYRPDAEPNGSGSSQGSQHEKQQSKKFGAVAVQSEPQISGAWPTCPDCSKPVIPQGLGSALKPATEPICLARKPLEKGLTLAENVLKWGTGGLNIDGCRIEGKFESGWSKSGSKESKNTSMSGKNYSRDPKPDNPQGRWPANLILDETAAEMLDEQSGIQKSATFKPANARARQGFRHGSQGESIVSASSDAPDCYGDSGGASRFFYVAKASKRERNAGLEGNEAKKTNDGRKKEIDNAYQRGLTERLNHHPTVKPIKLMEYLCTLITPPGGVILDPFMGSGSTGVAAKNLGFNFIGIEMDEQYFEIAKKRIEHAQGRKQ